jgi:Photoprotection regulator fluorescence recovery protein
MREPADVWELERYLTQRRKDIDRRYEFRNSRLKDVLGRLLYEDRLVEEDLRGLSPDKVERIRSFSQFLAEDVA